MGGYASISAGSVGSGAANAGYITRPSAAEEGDELYHNAPVDVERAETWEETRIRLRSWADQVEAEEKARHGNRAGQPRTHYRGVLSYEDKIDSAAARADAREFLEKEFPDAQAVAVVHQDTENTHVHIWMSARKLDDKKVHIDNQDLKDLHATFDEIYERRMQVPSRNADKIEETRQFKRRYAELKEQGASLEELEEWAEAHRPERATPPGPEVYRERDRRPAVDDLAQRADEIEEQEVRALSEVAERAQQHIDQRGTYERDERGSERAEREAGEGRASAGRGEQQADRSGTGQSGEEDRGGGQEPSEERPDSEEQSRDGANGSETGRSRRGGPAL